MELTGSVIILNGHEVSIDRANKIMFVQCTVLNKKYKVDMSTYPVSVNIDGYNPTENDLLPDMEENNVVRIDGDTEPSKSPVVKKCDTCGKKRRDNEQQAD